jgi:hypothetical protein
MNKKNKIICLFITIFLGAITYVYFKPTKSLWNTLDLYGYEKPEQKISLDILLKEAGVLGPTQSLKEYFPKRLEKADLLKDLIQFVKITQEHFSLRLGTKERWEVKPTSWMQEKPEIIEALNRLDIIFEILPKNMTPDAICILGSTYKTMVGRLNFLEELYYQKNIKFKHLILLAGERKVSIGIDGTSDELLAIALHQGVDLSVLTETHLIKEAYQKSKLFNQFETTVIDTPARDLPRPTTETTTMELIGWLKQQPGIKSILFISNQPYVNYQKAVIAEVFYNQNFTISYEITGDKASTPYNIQKLVESVGSYIWAKTPEVIRELGLTTENKEILEEIKNLYRNNPLIYKKPIK